MTTHLGVSYSPLMGKLPKVFPFIVCRLKMLQSNRWTVFAAFTLGRYVHIDYYLNVSLVLALRLGSRLCQ